MRRAVVMAAAAAALLVLSAGPAAAHAELRGTDPASGAALDRPPATIRLEFSEAVEVSFGAIRAYDSAGGRIETGRARHAGGRSDAVAVDPPHLDDGAYVITWRVISADSHPVRGAFTFRVGAPRPGDDTEALARRLLAAEGGSTTVGAVYGVARFLAFASLVLLVGGAAFVLGLWPGGRTHPAVRRLLAGAWALAVVTTVTGIALQGVYGAGGPLADVLSASVTREVLDTRFGRAWLARLLLLLAAAPLLAVAVRSRHRRHWVEGAAAALGAALLVTPGLAGHPATAHPAGVTVALDAVHLAAVSFWLGGLALLTAGLLRRGTDVDQSEVIPRFSRLAFGAVVVILATGTVQGWRQAGSIDAVTTTTYGRLLLVKVGLFAAMVALAGVSRAWVRRRSAAPVVAVGPGAASATAPPLSRLRRSVALEAAVAAAILAVTALLVNVVPGRTALAQPFSTELRAGPVLVDLTVDPAKAGPVDVHTYTLTPAGAVTDVEELTARLTLPAKSIGPLDVPLRRAGAGHFAAYGFEVPIPGTWRIEVLVRTSDIDQWRARTEVRIR